MFIFNVAFTAEELTRWSHDLLPS